MSRAPAGSLDDGRAQGALPWLVTGLVFLFALRKLDNPDTWWHLAAGRWIARNHAVPATDVLSFTVPDHPWINLQWLYDLTLYGLHLAGGPALLCVANALLFAVAFALLLANVRPSLGPIASSFLALWVGCIVSERFAIRPEVVSLILLQATLWVLGAARRGRSDRLWLLPPIMLVWVNSHALFVIGLFVIACHMLEEIATRFGVLPAWWRTRTPDAQGGRRLLLLAGAGSAVVTVLNPFGLRGMLFPLKLFTRIGGSQEIFRTIGEFTPPFSAAGLLMPVVAYQIFLCAAVVVVAIAGALAIADRRRAPPSRGAESAVFDLAGLLLFVGLAGLSLLARRNMALFAMGSAPFVAACLRRVQESMPRPAPGLARSARTAAVAALLLFVAGTAWSVASNRIYLWTLEPREFGADTLEMNFPIEAAAFVRQTNLPGRLFCDLTSGGYLTWDTPLGDTVYMDGRLEVYDDPFYEAYIDGLRSPEVWQAQADRAGVGSVLLDHRIPAHRRLIVWLNSDPRWALVYVDEVAVLFVRGQGNDAAIGRARERFASEFQDNARRLLERSPSWRWPMARMSAVANFADGLSLVGNADRAAEFHAALLAYDLPLSFESKVHLALARDYAAQGDLDAARAQIDKARQADPGSTEAEALRSQLGR